VREVRGRGLLVGVELTRPAAPVVDACREAGLLVLTAGEKVLRLAPPLVVQPAEVTRALEILKDVVAKAGG
jgi:acetylornithine/succinyldiaminopimelate/putrescine aminotransferase